MSKVSSRSKNSRSIMFSLYTLSGTAVLLVLAFVFSMWGQVLLRMFGGFTKQWQELLVQSLALVSQALILSVPLAFAVNYCLIVWGGSRWAKKLREAVRVTGECPELLYGLFLFVLFGGGRLSFCLIAAMLGAARLSNRWLYQSSRVKRVEIESLLALGMGRWQIVYHFFVKRFLVAYVGHLLAVMCEIFILTNPFLIFNKHSQVQFLSLEFLFSDFRYNPEVAAFAFSILIVHFLKLTLDQKIASREAPIG